LLIILPDESSQTLRSTSGLYDTYSNLLTTSTRLVKQLEKADWYDKLIIFCALGFFFLVVAFIVKRRVLDRAVNGVGWWVGGSYRLMTGQWKGKAARAAVKKGKEVVQSASVGSSVVSAVGGAASEAASGLLSTQVVAVATGIPEIGDGRIHNEL
jgi:protein transport protein SEC20